MPYFNEWIQPTQSYVKLTVTADGLYRVYKADLQAAGIANLNALTSNTIQLFYRGEEVPVYVEDSLGTLNFFEFVGWSNDGAIDSLLYREASDDFDHDPTQQTNVYRSLFSDTAAYFLTWDNANLRQLQAIAPSNFAAHVPLSHYRMWVMRDYVANLDYFPGGGGSEDLNYVLNPDYIAGEGYLSNVFQPSSSPDAVAQFVPTPGYANAGNPTRVVARVVGTNACQHILGIDLNLIDRYRDTTNNVNIETFAFDYSGPLSAQTLVRFHAYGTTTSIIDMQRVAWFSLEYDRLFDLNGDSTTTMRHWNQADTAYVKIYNATFDNAAWIYDVTRQERISATVDGDTLRFLVPGHGTERELYFFTDRAIQSVAVAPDAALDNVSDVTAGAEFVIITHRKFANSATQYAAYRDSSTVNRLSAKVVYIDQIYDEFGYGSHTPWAIKNFCRYAVENWAVRPKHFMIWGKGRNNERYDGRDNYVPTFGLPADDWEYVTNYSYDTTNLVPLAGMGRVSLYNDMQGLDYLAKVMDYELQPYAAHYKNVLMMGGGKSGSEQNAIFYGNDTLYRPLFENDPMNANVYTFQKRGSGIESNTDQTTEQLINGGMCILHYFGHSAVNIFELDILEPNRYTNWHKYPFMLAFGCTGGNFAEQGQSYGERWILEKDRGGIAFLGNTTLGFLTPLRDYAWDLYHVMNQDLYGASLGEIFAASLDIYGRAHNADYSTPHANHMKQTCLQGDPSIHLRVPTQPDLRIAEPDIYFPDGDPQALDPTFALNLILHNDGRSFTDSFAIVVRQRLPSGQTIDHDTVYYQPIDNLDTLELVLTNSIGLSSAGVNTFTVMVDAGDTIPEIYETNNLATYSQLFLGNLATPLFPAEYAIVGERTIYLQASTFVMSLGSPTYYAFEIDTVSTFNSPFKKVSGRVVGTAALGEWPIGFDMTPDQVYYWRVRLADYYPIQWIQNSFKYIPDKTGWSQSQYPQMDRDVVSGIRLDEINREWAFEELTSTLHAMIQATGKATYFLGIFGSQGEAPNGVFYTPIDQSTLIPWVRSTTRGDWSFTVAPAPGSNASIASVVQMINQTRDGDYFLLASSGNPYMAEWPDDAIRAFEQVGASYGDIRAMANGERILLFGQKGATLGTATVIIRPNLTPSGQSPIHDFLRVLSAPGTEGSIQSTILGPSTTWETLLSGWSSLDAMGGDSMALSVYGIRQDGTEELVLADLTASATQLGSVDATVYPRLRLQARAKDALNHSAPQLRSWEVYHDPAPDLAIDASLGSVIPDSLVEGERLQLRAFVRNITSVPMDSVWIRFALQKTDRSYIELGRRRYGAFAAKEIKQIEFVTTTAGIGLEDGPMTVLIEVNPDEEVVEQYHFNNLYESGIQIAVDQAGPIVDVTVDGKHLMTGDIVSPEPEIVIQINDDNPYLPVTVSDSTFRIWFGTERTYTNNPLLTIAGNDGIEASPVRMPDNKTRLTYKPGSLPDGEYTLAVQGYDVNGNVAGTKPYVIQMNVVNEKAMSEVLPYPNPFSTACHFAYTLTGGERPSRFDIEIYTVTGRLVKVIDLVAQGDVHFGRNITQYAWDGRDEFGDPLANGVYIYRVRTAFTDQGAIQYRDEGISDYFKNGFGKMYLMR